MNMYLFLIFVFFLSLSLIFLFKKISSLMNRTVDLHQSYAGNTNIPLIGGMVILFSMVLSSLYTTNSIIWFFAGMSLIGLFSDLKKLNSPIIRFLLQLFLIVFCVYSSDILLDVTRITFLDYLLNNYYFSIIFTSFCILIIVNGSNFIDGINSLAIGYYIFITIILLILKNDGFQISFNFPLNLLLLCLLVLFFFNLSNKLYLGDSGAYLLGFLFSIELINFYLKNTISPFFIILLLWYPAFENLFSIMRKINIETSPLAPDTNHLHQLIFIFLKKKKYSLLKANNVTGISINIYNGTIMMIAAINPTNTQVQIILIILNLLIYTFFYMRLFKYK